MNPYWLVRNAIGAWKQGASLADAARQMQWLYPRRRSGAPPPEWTINFRYSAPVGALHLVLRSNAGSDAFIFGEVFNHRYYDVGLPQKPTTILDLGANIGLTAIYFARLYPDAEIACVEPMPSNLRQLRQNLEMNRVDAKVFAAAIDVEDGEVIMEAHPMDYGHKVMGAAVSGALSTKCGAISVPTIMRRMGWERIGLLKMDIEGHEKTLFSRDCGWLNLVDAMLIECHDGFFSGDDLAVLTAKYGFNPPELRPGIWLVTRPGSATF